MRASLSDAALRMHDSEPRGTIVRRVLRMPDLNCEHSFSVCISFGRLADRIKVFHIMAFKFEIFRCAVASMATRPHLGIFGRRKNVQFHFLLSSGWV